MKDATVQIDYYALFREKRGLRSEQRKTSASTLGELYAELAAEYGFGLPVERVKVAVQDQFSTWERAVQEGDKIVFIPPVAGG